MLTAGISAAGANSLERFVALTGSLTWFVVRKTDLIVVFR